MPALLTPEAEVAAYVWLQNLDPAMRERGEKYFAGGAVEGLARGRRKNVFAARVRGGEMYEVTLDGADGIWSGECSCPVGEECKHCCAAMLGLLAQNDAQPAARPEVHWPALPVASAATFEEIATTKLGRKLAAPEQLAARTIDQLFAQAEASKVFSESRLDPVTGRRSARSWDTFTLWEDPPRSSWETWLYVADHLRQKQEQPLEFLRQLTDFAEVDAFISARHRREIVEQWQAWLRENAAPTGPVEIADAPIDLRVRLTEDGVQLEGRTLDESEFTRLKQPAFDKMSRDALQGALTLDAQAWLIWRAFPTGYGTSPFQKFGEPDCGRVLNILLRTPGLEERVLTPAGQPFQRAEAPLAWRTEPPAEPGGDYRLTLVTAAGKPPAPPLVTIDGRPALYVTRDTIFESAPLCRLDPDPARAPLIPAAALETTEGVALLDRLGASLPAPLAQRTLSVKAEVTIRCTLQPGYSGERLAVKVSADLGAAASPEILTATGWQSTGLLPTASGMIARLDRTAQRPIAVALEPLRVSWNGHGQTWERTIGKQFAEKFVEWLDQLPAGVVLELDPTLATLRSAPLSARISLEVEPAGVDWFDLRIALDVADSELTPAELRALLDARGKFVRLGAKGWRRLEFHLDEAESAQLADLGLDARDFSAEPQRLHALQLAGKAATKLLPEQQVAEIHRRALEIQTRVSPPLPGGIDAQLRPYQVEGFHFLAYLATNHFGGILADDMGLGKTVQTLTWLAWLRAQEGGQRPSLVVCPKSVTDNWLSESARFFPGLRVRLWRGRDAASLEETLREADLIVVNYAQLRVAGSALTAREWHAAILDEAQYIKNPESQTARAAGTLKTGHRLALSGTPIENRLLDLWSIMSFVMPGVLGTRASFSRSYDQKTDPLARRRLAARVRPFVLRRTKLEVAKDLPERIEEDLVCEMEGTQATLYRAELKRARLHLLKINTSSELDKARFNILTSLLRLRQICCHPALVSDKTQKFTSAKLDALLDVLEPLIEEGHKVLVFSQFVEMLSLIEREIVAREWPHFLLTGATEDRGALVADFQKTEGAAIFLISLRAGGFGLNLTAASYVVLFDPWWNPAVENQAIDRTHRIGQTNKVIAYRILVKESIEEKIRHLQKAKTDLAADILGEETFARALSLDDFKFLLSE